MCVIYRVVVCVIVQIFAVSIFARLRFSLGCAWFTHSNLNLDDGEVLKVRCKERVVIIDFFLASSPIQILGTIVCSHWSVLVLPTIASLTIFDNEVFYSSWPDRSWCLIRPSCRANG
jgi:hypothetical protein